MGLIAPHAPSLLNGRPLWFGSRRRKWEGKEKKEKSERKRSRRVRERTSIRSSIYGPSARGSKLVNRFARYANNKMV